MRHLELLGTPGAGKSTLLQQLKSLPEMRVNDRDLYSIAYDSFTRLTVPGKSLQMLCGWLYWNSFLKHSCMDQFSTQFPIAVEIIKKAGTLDNRSGYPDIYYTAGAEYICLRESNARQFTLDEGAVQLSGEISGLDPDLGEKFLKTLPAPDGVIHVQCSAEECLRRQKQRDKPLATSVSDLNQSDAISRLKQYNTHFEAATNILKERGANVVEVDTEANTPQECFKQVLTEFDDLNA